MATPRKPGAVRGRPKKPPKLKLPKGRPKRRFLSDPDRYVIALADAIQVALKKDPKEAVRIAVFESVVERFYPETHEEMTAYRDLLSEALSGHFVVVGEVPSEHTKAGGIKDTRYSRYSFIGARKARSWLNVESRIQVIMNKRRAYSVDKSARKWRAKMCAAFAAPLGRFKEPPDPKFGKICFENIAQVKHFALWKAREVGEERIAQQVIHPMIDRAAGIWSQEPPDFSLIFGSETRLARLN